MSISDLEQTVISMALGCLAGVRQYHSLCSSGGISAEDAEHFHQNSIALRTLVLISHHEDNGMAVEAIQKLRAIEQEVIELERLAKAEDPDRHYPFPFENNLGDDQPKKPRWNAPRR